MTPTCGTSSPRRGPGTTGKTGDGRSPSRGRSWTRRLSDALADRIESLRGELITDALMPIVREALAAAWDHGHRTANPVIPDTHRDVINPWKQP